MGRDVIGSVAENLRRASSSSFLTSHLWMWFADEESKWYRLFKPVFGRITISVPVGLTFASGWGKHTLASWRQELQVARWPDAFGNELLPMTVLNQLNRGLWNPNALRIFISRRFNIKYCLIVNENENPAAVARRAVFRRKREAFHHRIVLTKSYQGHGFASKLLANTIPFYRELGVVAVKLIAGLSAGSKVWPKFGFRPVSKREWKKIHREIRRNLRRLDQGFKISFQDIAGERIEPYVERILAKPAPQGIWALSDLDDDKWPPVPNWKVGLGSFLLQNTRWKGILDLEDPRAVTKLENRLNRSGKGGPLR
jgi:GNAT superfamily N-acetyltransferase